MFQNTWTKGGDVYPALFNSFSDVGRVVGLQQGTVSNAGQRVWGYINSWAGDASQVGFYVDQSNSLFNSSVVEFWNLGCYSGPINGAAANPAYAGAVGSTAFPKRTFASTRIGFASQEVLIFPSRLMGVRLVFLNCSRHQWRKAQLRFRWSRITPFNSL